MNAFVYLYPELTRMWRDPEFDFENYDIEKASQEIKRRFHPSKYDHPVFGF